MKRTLLLFVMTISIALVAYAQSEDAKYIKIHNGLGIKDLSFGYRVYCEDCISWTGKMGIKDKTKYIGIKNDIFTLGFYYQRLFGMNTFPCFFTDMYFENHYDEKVLIEWRETAFTGREYPVTGLSAHYKAEIVYANETVPEFNVKEDFVKPYKETGELQVRRCEVPFYIIYGGETHIYNIVFEFAYPWEKLHPKNMKH